MHARFYGSSIGRFLRPDPIGGNPANPQSWNLYAYVLGNPVNYNDPTGLYTNHGAKEAKLPSPLGTAWEMTMVEKHTMLAVTQQQSLLAPSNDFKFSSPYGYTNSGGSGCGVACSGEGSEHFQTSYPGDPDMGNLLFSLLVKYKTEIVFSQVQNPLYADLTIFFWAFDTSKKAKIDASTDIVIRDVWDTTFKFVNQKGVNLLWQTFGHVEPGCDYTPLAVDPVFSMKSPNVREWYQPVYYAGSENDVTTYNNYTRYSEFYTHRPALVLLFGRDQWFQFSP